FIPQPVTTDISSLYLHDALPISTIFKELNRLTSIINTKHCNHLSILYHHLSCRSFYSTARFTLASCILSPFSFAILVILSDLLSSLPSPSDWSFFVVCFCISFCCCYLYIMFQ